MVDTILSWVLRTIKSEKQKPLVGPTCETSTRVNRHIEERNSRKSETTK